MSEKNVVLQTISVQFFLKQVADVSKDHKMSVTRIGKLKEGPCTNLFDLNSLVTGLDETAKKHITVFNDSLITPVELDTIKNAKNKKVLFYHSNVPSFQKEPIQPLATTIETASNEAAAYLYASMGVHVFFKDDTITMCVDLSKSPNEVVRVPAPPVRPWLRGNVRDSPTVFHTYPYMLGKKGGLTANEMKYITAYLPEWDNFRNREYFAELSKGNGGQMVVRVSYTDKIRSKCIDDVGFASIGEGPTAAGWENPVSSPGVCLGGQTMSPVESKVYLHPSFQTHNMFSNQKEAEDFIQRLI